MKRSSVLVAIILSCWLVAPATRAHDEGDWLVRFGASNVAPESNNGTLLGFKLDVEDAWSLTFNGTRMLTPNWAIELLAAAPFDHEINLVGVGRVGSTKHLPPTVSGQYHFLPDGRFQPYVGIGVNFTIFFDESAEGALQADNPGNRLSIEDNSLGLAAQVGADVSINDNWFVNFDVRYIRIETEARVTFATGSVLVPSGGVFKTDVDINPLVYGVHVGRRF